MKCIISLFPNPFAQRIKHLCCVNHFFFPRCPGSFSVEKDLLRNLKGRSRSHPLMILLQHASQVVLVVKNLAANAGDMRPKFDPWPWEIPWRRAWPPTPVFCLENPVDRGAWWAIVYRVAKCRTQLKCLAHTQRHW